MSGIDIAVKRILEPHRIPMVKRSLVSLTAVSMLLFPDTFGGRTTKRKNLRKTPQNLLVLEILSRSMSDDNVAC